MNERMVVISKTLVDPDESAALSTLDAHFVTPVALTIVYVSAAPLEDDAGATLDINDDGTGVITAIDVSDADVPGTWSSTHFGGSNAPILVAGGSEISIDLNSAAAANAFQLDIWALVGETRS